MRWLMWSFLRRGCLRALAAGMAVGLAVIAVVSYGAISHEIRQRATYIFSGSMPADGYIVLHSGYFDAEQQDRISGATEVVGCQFTALADGLLPSGPGQVEGVDFSDSFFSFPLVEGRLPTAGGEAVVDSSLGELAAFKVGCVVTLQRERAEPQSLRIVGVLDPSALAPRGILVDRSYCLSEAMGGRLARVWVRLTAGSGDETMKILAYGLPDANYDTPTAWRDRYSGGTLLFERFFSLLLGVLIVSLVVALWVLGSFSLAHNAALLRTAYALGVSLRDLVVVVVCDGLLSGIVAAILVGGALWLRPSIGGSVDLSGPSWLVALGLVLPMATMLVIGAAVMPKQLAGASVRPTRPTPQSH